MLWGLSVPPKLKHFWWRCYHNSLATKQNIYRCRCTRDGVYPVCLGEPEFIEHLLCGCAWTKAVWFGSDLGLILQVGIMSISKWMCDLYFAFSNSMDRVPFFSMVVLVGWLIWKSRNALVFNGSPMDPISIIFQVIRDSLEFLTVASRHKSGSDLNPASVAVSNVGWTAPSPGCFKANYDVAMAPDSTMASIAVLFRNRKGELVDGTVQRLDVQSVMQGEAFMTKTLNLSQVKIEGDNKSVISLCVSEDAPFLACAPIIEDIRALARCSHLSFHWSPRTANGAAHWTARASLSVALPVNWVLNPPRPLVKALG